MARILVVDDEEKIIKIFSTFLSKMGFEVIEVVGGEAAIGFLKSGMDMDLMILDMKMPKVTGLDVLKVKHSLNDRRPVIIVTGSMGQEEVHAEVKELSFGREKVIHKPVDLFLLLDEIKKQLGMKI